MAMTGIWFPEKDAATTEFKTTIVRWNMATYALMCYTADPDCTTDQGVANCATRGLLTPEEASLVTSLGGNAVLPLQWVMGVYAKNLDNHRGRDFKMDKIESKILQSRGSIGGALTAVSSFGLTPLPLVHLMSALVKMVSPSFPFDFDFVCAHEGQSGYLMHDAARKQNRREVECCNQQINNQEELERSVMLFSCT